MGWLHLPFATERGIDHYFEEDLAALSPVVTALLCDGKRVVVHAMDWDSGLGLPLARLLAALQPDWPENRATRTAEKLVGEGQAAMQALSADF